jgi:8-oxo-dGTP pyrophosphatase MutT (NUDIX family)
MAKERTGVAQGSEPATPRPAASVLLLRAAKDDPFEVFIVRRAAGGTWPHLHVFPGGRVDETDGGSFEAAAVRELFEEVGVRIEAAALVPFSHWITPERVPHRFDTYFFIARIPEGQTARADEIETHDGRWIAPRTALLHFGEGTLPMIYPTVKHLERLLLFRDLDELFAFAKVKAIQTVMPKIYDDNVFAMSRELEHRW